MYMYIYRQLALAITRKPVPPLPESVPQDIQEVIGQMLVKVIKVIKGIKGIKAIKVHQDIRVIKVIKVSTCAFTCMPAGELYAPDVL